MRAARWFAAMVCGRWTKWVVVSLWVVIFAIAGPLAGKLNGVEKNDNATWLPGSALPAPKSLPTARGWRC